MTRTHHTPYRTRFHRDGTVTYWHVYEQRWRKRTDVLSIPDTVIATLPWEERQRVIALRDEAREDQAWREAAERAWPA